MPDRKKLYLVDGYSDIFRAFYALPGLSTSKGVPTNATWGFLQMLRKLLREEEPELVGVALDVSGDTVRKEKFEEYKAQRAPMPDDLKAQIPWIRKTIEAHRIPILELERYEADDVLGTLAKKATAAGYEVILVSPDKDLLQLVDDHVKVLHTRREKVYDPAEVEADYGVPPARITDWLALVGDSSDNVPGVPLIGKKTASTLLGKHGSLEKLLENAGEIGGKRGESLRENADVARRSHDLVTIETELPIEFDPEALAIESPDPEALRELCRELEFFSMLDELKAAAPGEGLEIPPALEVEDVAAWERATAELGGRIALATVGEPPIGLAVAGEEGAVHFADFRNDGLRAAALESVGGWAADSDRTLVGHDLKETLRLVAGGGPEGSGGPAELAAARLVDTLLVSFLLRSAQHSHTLEEVALERLGYSAVAAKEAGWAKGAEPPSGSAGLLAYAGERAGLPRAIAEPMLRELGDGDLAKVYAEIEAPLVPVVLAMEETGVLLDSEFLEGMSKELGGELDGIETAIYELAGDQFNLNSPSQLGEVMFERLGYPVIKKTRKTKSYSTDQATLEELAARGYELPEKVLRYRELTKLKSTYVDALPAMVAEDGRLHTRYNQAGAATGRLSSTNPNLQNIPIRTEQGQRIRKAFRAPDGSRLVVADYNQIELRVMAHIAGEEELVEAFRRGEDIHRTTAGAIFGADPELVAPEQRRAAKTINFGILYGMSAFGLAQRLGIDRGEASKFIKTYLERFPAVGRYMEETVEAAKETGRVETLYGRVRWLPDIRSKNFHLRENAKRMAINARIQGTAADLQKLAMIAVDGRLRRDHAGSRLLLTVHDELVLEVPEADVEAVSEAVRAEMSGVADLAVPLKVDVGSGESWYEAKA